LSARLHQIEGRLDALETVTSSGIASVSARISGSLETATAGLRHDLARLESALSSLNVRPEAARPADDLAIPEYTDSEYDPAIRR
jgi:hypothetical protein